MKHFNIIVVGGLCASLLLNYSLLTKLDALDNKINNVSNYQYQVINTVNSQVSNINHTINKIKEEQSWLSVVNVKTEFSNPGSNKAEVSFEWQVKELENNAEVLFNYRTGEDQEYTPIKAEDKGNGFFRVVVPIEVNPEPNWNLQINNMKEREIGVMEEQKEAFQMANRPELHYYISLSRGEMLKSSDINIAPIDDIGARYYGYLEVRTDINKDNNYHLSVMNGKMSDTSTYLREAYLKKYRDGVLLDEEKLEKEKVIYEDGMIAREDAPVFYNKITEEKMDYSSLVLKVIYSDGAVFEREVYSK